MIDTVYIEETALEHPRTQAILERFSKAHQIVVSHYGEVFNSHAQNFRLQKRNPALIIATKQNRLVLPTPPQYETGGAANYYFSHMLNCLYDCRYCFLQGMFRSAHYLLFVNYEDFMEEIIQLADKHSAEAESPWFFSGYDCDSLAMEPITGFANWFLSEFEKRTNAVLELRTKSTQVRSLLTRPAMENAVVAFSLSPEPVAQSVESGAPSTAKRIQAMRKLQDHSWRVGVRFDPVIWHQGWQQNYKHLIESLSQSLVLDQLDSITLGGFRLPKGYYKIMRKLHPEHWLFSAGLEADTAMVSYTKNVELEMFDAIEHELRVQGFEDRIYRYPSHEPVTEQNELEGA